MTSPVNNVSGAVNNTADINSPASQTYFPKPGENISDIASKFGVPAADIEESNPGVIPNLLQAGKALNIPAAKIGGSDIENRSSLDQSIARGVPDNNKPQTQTNQFVPGKSVPGVNTEEERKFNIIEQTFGKKSLYDEVSKSTESASGGSKECVGRMTVTTTARPTETNKTAPLPIGLTSITTISPLVLGQDAKYRIDPTAQVAAQTSFTQETKPITEIKAFAENKVVSAPTLNDTAANEQYKSTGTLQVTNTRDISTPSVSTYVDRARPALYLNVFGQVTTVLVQPKDVNSLNSVKISQTSASEVSGYCKFSTGEVIKAQFSDLKAQPKQEIQTIRTGDTPARANVGTVMPQK